MIHRIVAPFKTWHYDWLVAQDSAEGSSYRLSKAAVEMLERENSWTGVVDGAVVVCAGTVKQWEGRHTAWAYIARNVSRRHMPWITQEVVKAVQNVQGRIEFTVRCDFPGGQRWAKRLGFQVETPCLKAYGPEGEDHVGFVRLN